MASTPTFAATPKTLIGQVTATEPSRTAPANVATVYTAGASGSRIDAVTITAAGTTTANMVRLFIHDGSAYRLLQEVPVNAITPSDSVAVYSNTIVFTVPLCLQSGYSLRATTDNAETYNVIAHGGDF